MYTLHDLRHFGRKKGWCPYFLARHMMAFANVVVYNYQYMIDPKVSQASTSQEAFGDADVQLGSYVVMLVPVLPWPQVQGHARHSCAGTPWQLPCRCTTVDGVTRARARVCGGV